MKIDFNIYHKCILILIYSYIKLLIYLLMTILLMLEYQIYIIKSSKIKWYINDVDICQDRNNELNYIYKINKYKELQEKLI